MEKVQQRAKTLLVQHRRTHASIHTAGKLRGEPLFLHRLEGHFLLEDSVEMNSKDNGRTSNAMIHWVLLSQVALWCIIYRQYGFTRFMFFRVGIQ